MTIDADESQAFYERAREVMGPDWAATLVRAIPPAGADALATKADFAALEERMSLRLQTGLGDLRTEMAELRGELRGEMAELRDGLRGEMADVRSEFSGLRVEIADKLRAQTWTLSGLLVGALAVTVALTRIG